MNRIRLIYARLYGLLYKKRIEQEMDEEMRFHIGMRMRESIERGLKPDDAGLDAQRRFGNLERIKDAARDIRGGGMLETLLQDARFGIRTMLKSPGFTLVAVLALALGIGANTAIFSVVNAVLLRPLPYRNPERVVRIYESNPARNAPTFSISPANYLDWKKQSQVFESMAAYSRQQNLTLTGGDRAQQVVGARVSAEMFPMLGINPALGRAFLPEEDRTGGERVVVISHGLWQRGFGADQNLLGRMLTLDQESYTVIGVMPAGFQLPNNDAELWMPLTLSPNQMNRAERALRVLARLKPDKTLEQARAELGEIARRLEEQYPQSNLGWGVVIRSLDEVIVGDEFRQALLVLLGAVGFVLLIACANVANLLLARAAARRKEIAVRIALGAGRLRLVRQLLTESLMLALMGGAAGFLLAVWGVGALVSLSPGNIPRVDEISVDTSVLGFTLLVSLLTGIVFGIVPALQASQSDLHGTLKEAGRSSSESFTRRRLLSLLVVSEATLALVLLVGAGLLIKSFVRLQAVDPGFNPANVQVMQLVLPKAKYAEDHQIQFFYQQLLQRIAALPGVQSVAAASGVPMSGGNSMNAFSVEGRPAHPAGKQDAADYRTVTPNYFSTMGIRLLKGRYLTEQDHKQAPSALLINETMMRRFFADEDAIGKQISLAGLEDKSFTVVGVVRDVRELNLETEARPAMYMSHTQAPASRSMSLVVRTAFDPAQLSAAMRSEVTALDKEQPVANMRTMKRIVSDSIAQPRFTTILLSVFAAIALILAATGIYSVMAYSVTQRTHEIGIRMALGARAADVLRMVVRQGMVLALAGVATGLLMAFGLTRLMSGLLYGVSASDPVIYAGVALLLTSVAILACYIPARRATKIDPIIALRYE